MSSTPSSAKAAVTIIPDLHVTFIANDTVIYRPAGPTVPQLQHKILTVLRRETGGRWTPLTYRTQSHGTYFEKNTLRRLVEKSPGMVNIPLYRNSNKTFCDARVLSSPSSPRASPVPSPETSPNRKPPAPPARKLQDSARPSASTMQAPPALSWLLKPLRVSPLDPNARVPVPGGSQLSLPSNHSYVDCMARRETHPYVQPTTAGTGTVVTNADKTILRLFVPGSGIVYALLIPLATTAVLVTYQPADEPFRVSGGSAAGTVRLSWATQQSGRSVRVALGPFLWSAPKTDKVEISSS